MDAKVLLNGLSYGKFLRYRLVLIRKDPIPIRKDPLPIRKDPLLIGMGTVPITIYDNNTVKRQKRFTVPITILRYRFLG